MEISGVSVRSIVSRPHSVPSNQRLRLGPIASSARLLENLSSYQMFRYVLHRRLMYINAINNLTHYYASFKNNLVNLMVSLYYASQLSFKKINIAGDIFLSVPFRRRL